jgi:hypothetical protein
MGDKFASPEELETQITALKTMDSSVIKKEMQGVIRYIFNAEG